MGFASPQSNSSEDSSDDTSLAIVLKRSLEGSRQDNALQFMARYGSKAQKKKALQQLNGIAFGIDHTPIGNDDEDDSGGNSSDDNYSV